MRGDRARSLADGTRFTDVRWLDETSSTNDDVLAAAREGAAEGLVVVADHQTAGRGRMGRPWQAPPGASLLCTVLLRPALSIDDAHLAVHAVALAAQAACRTVAGVTPQLKWPNDLLEPEGTRKVGGILAETVVIGDRLEAVAVGLGLNVAWPHELPADLAEIATALNHVGAPDGIDREELLGALLLDLDQWCDQVDSEKGRGRLRRAYVSVCATVGQRVRVVRTDGGELVGMAEAVEVDGSLRVRADDGATHIVTVGDVTHLRPA
jgi:BirA family biotin operon repressor/biotin-[acetyl-CoA-carboxylase] ligase